ncbi:uncharacterized protein [Lepisosteus oculatus]|uniref:uncharacterized protein isoform X3 n=1 Tax=Lepisosteus oculatus TaxID=7918 RepID=UPI0035F5262B
MPVHGPGRGRARGSSFALWSAWIQLLPLLTEGLLQVSVKYGQAVTLPCDGTAHVPRIPEDQLHVLWKTLDQHVYEFMDGKFYPSAGFEHRAQMSQEEIRRGDFSLTLGRTTFSDEHVYECLLEADKEYLLASMELSILAHRDTVTLQPGASLSVPLFTGEPVEVLFEPAGAGDSTSVCSVQNGTPRCVPQYRDRVSVENQELRLQDLRKSDQGNYTALLSHSRRAISIVSLTVGGGDSHFVYLWILVPVALLLVVLGVGLVLYRKRQGRWSGSAVRYSPGDNMVEKPGAERVRESGLS